MSRFFVLGLFLSIASFASPPTKVVKLFNQHFDHRYESSKCGENARGFAADLKKLIGNTDDFYLLMIRNKGSSTFGMVNAEHARTTRFNKPAAAESNWHFHAFIVDRFGYVYDFDFGAKPKIVELEHYFKVMFFDEPECQKRIFGEFCGGENKKRKDYEVGVVAAEAILKSLGAKPTAKISLGEFLSEWQRILK